MKRFIKTLMVFILLLFAGDRTLFFFLQTQRPVDYKLFLDSKEDFFNENQNIDLLIIGDSHVADALDTRTIEKATKLNSYNLGIYHSSPYENYYVILAALKHLKKKPKQVILGTNPIMFQRALSKGKYSSLIIKDKYIKFKLSYNSEEGIGDASIFLKSLQEKYLVKHIINKILGKEYIPTREIRSVHNGHLEFYNQTKNLEWSNFKRSTNEANFNNKQIDYFKKIVELLIEMDIEVVIVNPPIWFDRLDVVSEENNFREFEKILNSISEKYNIEIFNENHLLLNNELEKKDFLNTEHLNYYGAKKFSIELSDFLLNKVE